MPSRARTRTQPTLPDGRGGFRRVWTDPANGPEYRRARLPLTDRGVLGLALIVTYFAALGLAHLVLP